MPYDPGRPADAYIFAWHPIVEHEVADHRHPEQWRFFVLPEQILPNQKTISVNRLKNLGPDIGYALLSTEVGAQIGLLTELKIEKELRNGLYVKPSRFENRQSKV